MQGSVYDLAIIGGGINGAGIAADAAGRGLRVILFEKNDLASGTSSASSKLIHGGLRYLEHFEFRLVREALGEREVLLERAPHLISPLRFIIPHGPGMRPRLVLRLGLVLYDHLARRQRLPASSALDLGRDPAGRPLKGHFQHGFSYYDCWVDDARLVVAAALDAAERGAVIHTGTPVTRAARHDGLWEVTARISQGTETFRARALVNAAGPWCAEVAALIGESAVPHLRLVKGSHIVVPRIAGAQDAYLLQNPDGRVVFVLPFGERFSLIGTTEVTVGSPAEGAAVMPEEEAYLIDAVSRFFARPIPASSIVWRFAGVRPLLDDGAKPASAVSRDYRLDLDAGPGEAPLLTIVGGKITTFRRLAEAALEKLAPFFPAMGPAWTSGAPLPGGDMGANGFVGYCQHLFQSYPDLSHRRLERLVRLYGTRAERVLGDAKTERDLGEDIGGGLTAREVIYLRDHEWARTADDVLWRRTKAGVGLDTDEAALTAARITELLVASG